jgi:hypothetical protein
MTSIKLNEKLYCYSVKGTGIDLEDDKQFSIGESSFQLKYAIETIEYYTSNDAFSDINLTLQVTSL